MKRLLNFLTISFFILLISLPSFPEGSPISGGGGTYTGDVYSQSQVDALLTPIETIIDILDSDADGATSDEDVTFNSVSATHTGDGTGLTLIIGGCSDGDCTASEILGDQTIDLGTATIGGEDAAWTLPTFPTMTWKASELTDTSDPHTLIAGELRGLILTNSESIGADEWDFPARSEGWDFCFVKEADQNVTLDPNGTEQWEFRTSNAGYTQLSAGEAIVNTTAGQSTICCFSTESAVYCTGDANWAEETP